MRTNVNNKKPVAQYTTNMEFIAEYKSILDAQKATKVDDASICEVCKNHRKTAGGFKWKYIENK